MTCGRKLLFVLPLVCVRSLRAVSVRVCIADVHLQFSRGRDAVQSETAAAEFA